MFDDIFLVFNEYAYQFERDLPITREKQRILLRRMVYILMYRSKDLS